MLRLRVFFLLAVLAATPGFRMRCILFCTDQTSIQEDYVEQRDRCREYSQLKLDMALHEAQGPIDDKLRHSTLTSLFSECMSRSSWSVPDGKDKKPDAPAAAAAAAAAGVAPVAAPPTSANADSKAAISRSAECAFARESASVSSISASRAEACDLECAQRLKAAPGAPHPAACPEDVSSSRLNSDMDKNR